MTTSLQAYHHYNNLGVGDTTDLYGDSGWLETNENFDGNLKVLRRDNRGGTTGKIGTDGPLMASTATVTASYSAAGSDTDFGGRQESRSVNKERKKF